MSYPRTLTLSEIADAAGYPSCDGRLALPNTQQCADDLAAAARRIVLGGKAEWEPGDPSPADIDLTGAGPVWAYLSIAHALHGLTPRLRYASPAATIVIHSHTAD